MVESSIIIASFSLTISVASLILHPEGPHQLPLGTVVGQKGRQRQQSPSTAFGRGVGIRKRRTGTVRGLFRACSPYDRSGLPFIGVADLGMKPDTETPPPSVPD